MWTAFPLAALDRDNKDWITGLVGLEDNVGVRLLLQASDYDMISYVGPRSLLERHWHRHIYDFEPIIKGSQFEVS